MDLHRERLSRSTVLALGAASLAIFVVANDFTSLTVALPAIEQDFHIDVSTVQWTVNAYSLGFGVLAITGGRFADIFGRRRIFVVGAVLFAAFSVLGALAASAGLLIAARALMSVGGALKWPATLGMTYALLPESRRGLAGGLVLGVGGFGNAAGPLIGGVITDGLGWRYILALNAPIAIIAVGVALRTVPESRDTSAQRRIDWPGMATVSGALVALLLALDEAGSWGWGSPGVVGLLVTAAILFAAAVAVERRCGGWALLPRDVVRNAGFVTALVAVLFMSMTFFTVLFYLPQFMEKVLGYSALRAGVGLLPLMIVFGCASLAAGRLYDRLGAKPVVTVGAAALPLGMLALSFLSADSGYAALVPGMILLGLGLGLFYSAVLTIAVSSLDGQRVSLAGGVVYMIQVAGGSIGLGVATVVVVGFAGSQAQASGHAGAAFVDGLQTAFGVSAALALVGFVITLLFVGGPLRQPRAASGIMRT